MTVDGWVRSGGEALIRKDFELAAELYRKAADAGDGRAQGALAALYENGVGVEQSIAEALGWYKRAALQGNAFAINKVEELGHLGQQDARTSQIEATVEAWVKAGDEAKNRVDYKKAIEFYQRAAYAGDACAQYKYGSMYASGRGTIRSIKSAIYWYQKAVTQNGKCSGVAKFDLERLTESAAAPLFDRVAPLVRPVARPSEISQKMPSAATVESWFRSGVAAYNEQNYTSTLKWYGKAAEQGHAGAQNNLGYMYAKGKGVTQNDTEAVKWFRKAAAAGERVAQCNLAWHIAWGQGTAKDPTSAADWTIKSLQNGEESCIKNMTESATVREIQKILKQRGLYTGAIDGSNGPNTQAAMRKLLPK